MKLQVDKLKSLKYRFEMKFKIDKPNKCWIWLKHKNKKGYGIFGIASSKSVRAHRFSYELYVGKIPKGLLVCHKCDNPACVNPNHLWLGTIKENNSDRDKKGRCVSLKGEKNGHAKITDKIAREIKQRIISGEPMTKIARELNIKYCIVANIKSGSSWKHINF